MSFLYPTRKTKALKAANNCNFFFQKSNCFWAIEHSRDYVCTTEEEKLTSPEQLFWHSGWQCRHSLSPANGPTNVLVYTPVTVSHRLRHCWSSRKLRQETHWSSRGPQHPSSEHSGEHTSLSATATTATSFSLHTACFHNWILWVCRWITR